MQSNKNPKSEIAEIWKRNDRLHFKFVFEWRRSKFPFRKRSMPFSRHLEIFLTVNEFFSTKLKKKENL